jgi:hypothetical protein
MERLHLVNRIPALNRLSRQDSNKIEGWLAVPERLGDADEGGSFVSALILYRNLPVGFLNSMESALVTRINRARSRARSSSYLYCSMKRYNIRATAVWLVFCVVIPAVLTVGCSTSDYHEEGVWGRSIHDDFSYTTNDLREKTIIEQNGAASGSQPIRPETNSTPSAAGSRR